MSRFRAHKLSADGGYDGEPLDEEVSYVSCVLQTKRKDRIRVEMRYDEHENCVKIRCPEGRLVVVPGCSNEIFVFVDAHGDRLTT